MEFAASAMTSAAGGAAGVTQTFPSWAGGAPVAEVGGAASGLKGALGPTSLWSSILSGGATAASVLAAKKAADDKARSYEYAAADAETETQIEAVAGLQRRASLKRQFAQAVGERDVATAASGVDVSFGTPSVIRAKMEGDTTRAVTLDQETENLRVARLRERAASYRIMAQDARAGGLLKAAGIGLEGAAGLARRFAS